MPYKEQDKLRMPGLFHLGAVTVAIVGLSAFIAAFGKNSGYLPYLSGALAVLAVYWVTLLTRRLIKGRSSGA
jgi:hypothetical protein